MAVVCFLCFIYNIRNDFGFTIYYVHQAFQSNASNNVPA